MARRFQMRLGKREREIMEIIFRLGSASVQEVVDEMAKPPSYSAVRATITTLEQKGHLKHRRQGLRYIYAPTASRKRAGRSILREAVNTFFAGSAVDAAAALLDESATQLTDDELARLEELVRKAGKGGRRDGDRK